MQILLADVDAYRNWVSKAAVAIASGATDIEAMDRPRGTEIMQYGTDGIISVHGPLSYKADIWSFLMGGSDYQSIGAQLHAANHAEEIKRVVMVFDTPGGEVTGIRELATQIKESKKPVVAVVDPQAASAGLWLASQASRIVSTVSGEIGSLGVQAITMNYSRMLEEEGIDVQIFRAGISPEKNLGHPYEPMGEKAEEYLQDRVDRAGKRFLAAVADGRGVSESDALSKFGQGKMLESDEALEVGLIDEVGSLSSVLAEGQQKDRSKARYNTLKNRR